MFDSADAAETFPWPRATEHRSIRMAWRVRAMVMVSLWG